MESASEVGCPRCGYDQRGVLDTWPDADPPACPLTGVCSECGLTFAWGDVLVPGRVGPRWCWERGEGARVGRLMSTAVRAVWPGRFWRAMPLALPIRYGRLLLMVLVPVVVYHLACVGIVVWDEWQSGRWTLPPPPGGWYRPRSGWAYVWPYGESWSVGVGSTFVPQMVWWWLLPVALLGLAMLVLGQSFKRARVRRGHLLRAAAYAVPWAMVQATLASVVVSGLYWVEDAGWVRLSLGWAGERAVDLVGIGLCGLWVVTLGWWWYRVVERYLRLDRAGVIAALMFIVAALGTFVAFAVTHNGVLADIITWLS